MKPILFNTEMVKAILDGRKTVTRRKVKPQPKSNVIHGICTASTDNKDVGKFGFGETKGSRVCEFIKPPYKVGDVLYVREAALIQSMSASNESVKMLFKDGELHSFKLSKKEYERLLKYADSNKFLSPYWLTKQEARIFLKVTDVRVERLQDITPEQAVKEGVYKWDQVQCVMDFAYLWDSTVNKTDLDQFGWTANPWVWVIEFERCEKEAE